MSKTVLRVAALQLCSQDRVEENLTACEELTLRAAALGARVVVLPENFAHMGSGKSRLQMAESLQEDGPILSRLRKIASGARVTLIAGGMPERSEDSARPYNTAVVLAPDGHLLASYRKLHLFDVDVADGRAYRESAATLAGEQPLVVEVEGWRVGLSICYDLRFPELYRALCSLGADVFVVPSAFTLTTGKDHWHPLLRARAIEGQSWVVAAAQCGTHPEGRQTYGHSLVVDPWGTIVAEASDGITVVCADLDPVLLARVREALPSLKHRRL